MHIYCLSNLNLGVELSRYFTVRYSLLIIINSACTFIAFQDQWNSTHVREIDDHFWGTADMQFSIEAMIVKDISRKWIIPCNFKKSNRKGLVLQSTRTTKKILPTDLGFGSMVKCTLAFSLDSSQLCRWRRFWNMCSVKKGVKGAIMEVIRNTTEHRACMESRHWSVPSSPWMGWEWGWGGVGWKEGNTVMETLLRTGLTWSPDNSLCSPWREARPTDHAIIMSHEISSNFTYLEPPPVESHVPVGELLDELDQSWHHSVEMVL